MRGTKHKKENVRVFHMETNEEKLPAFVSSGNTDGVAGVCTIQHWRNPVFLLSKAQFRMFSIRYPEQVFVFLRFLALFSLGNRNPYSDSVVRAINGTTGLLTSSTL